MPREALGMKQLCKGQKTFAPRTRDVRAVDDLAFEQDFIQGVANVPRMTGGL
jgi:hypothetical protein